MRIIQICFMLIIFTINTAFASPTPSIMISGDFKNESFIPWMSDISFRSTVEEGYPTYFEVNDSRDGQFFLSMPVGKSSTIVFTQVQYPGSEMKREFVMCKFKVSVNDETHASFEQIETPHSGTSVGCKLTGDVNNNTAVMHIYSYARKNKS